MRKNRYLQNIVVLHAEDSDILREKIGDILSHMVGVVVSAKDGEEAYRLYKELQPDIIFLDNQMPKMSGREVAIKIRAEDDNVPIVFVTAIDDTDELIECIKLSLTDYLLKPISVEKLEEALDKCVAMLGDYADSSNQKEIYRGVLYDGKAKGVVVDGFFVHFTKYEYRLVELLISKAGAVCTNEEIESVVYEGEMSAAALRNAVKRIREKSGVDFVESVKNMGYKLKERDDS